MKANESRSPLNETLIIVFKRSPYFRFYLTKFIKVAWRVNSTSLQYFSGEELLSLYYYIHLENGTDDPINFRPKHHNKFNGKSLKQHY